MVLILADCNGVDEIDGYRSLGTRSPWLALSLAIALFSLIGVPPMAGFLGKWFLFAAAVQTLDPWCVAAVVAGLLNSVLSVYYYFRIMKAMYLEKGEGLGPIRSPLHPQLGGGRDDSPGVAHHLRWGQPLRLDRTSQPHAFRMTSMPAVGRGILAPNSQFSRQDPAPTP